MKETIHRQNSQQLFKNMTKTKKQKYQKNNAPPRTKVCGLNGACFLDAREVNSTLKCGVLEETSRHQKIAIASNLLVLDVLSSL